MCQEIGLYIHIPYCIRKCRYCDFLSFADRYHIDGGAYFRALQEELVFLSARFGTDSAYRIKSVFIGGGTPSAVKTSEIVDIMDTVQTVFHLTEYAEISIEANPGTVDRDQLHTFYREGINRLSLGIQSLDDNVLRGMGRIHTARDAMSAYYIARNAGFCNINMDLMLGFPEQCPEVFENTLHQAVALNPEHISAYSLIVEEGTPLCEDIERGLLPEPEQEADRQMYHRACSILEEAGYKRYEISNFARPGHESRHNLGYWTGVYYLGAGLGAASYLPGERFKNTEDMRIYLESSPDKKRDRGFDEFLSRQDEMNEFMMLGFRLAKGPDEAAFRSRFGVPYTQIYQEPLNKLLCEGLIKQKGSGYCLSEKGLDLGNLVFGAFV